jgi:hypothetical protein
MTVEGSLGTVETGSSSISQNIELDSGPRPKRLESAIGGGKTGEKRQN